MLQRHIKFYRKNQRYHFSDIILSLIYIIILGIQRITKTHILQYNGFFKKVIGIKQFPDVTAIRRFLHRLPTKVIRQIVKVHFMIQSKLEPKGIRSATFDIDPTAITVYGRQQRARVGYNPKQRGKRCYSLMLCFEDERQEFWLGQLNSGNVAVIKAGRYFISKCLKKLPSSIKRIKVRLDSGFYGYRFVEWLEKYEKESEKRIFYTIEAQIKKPMIEKTENIEYEIFEGDWEVGEFYYQPRGWKSEYKFISIRRPLPEKAEECRQLSLFELKGYGYRVLVTNLKMKPESIWRFHCQRARGAELNIRELKNSYNIIKIPTKRYTANIAYIQIILLAYNIVNWFKRICLPEEFRYATLQTIREKVLHIPGRMIDSGHKNILKLPGDYHYQELFNIVLSKIEKLKI